MKSLHDTGGTFAEYRLVVVRRIIGGRDDYLRGSVLAEGVSVALADAELVCHPKALCDGRSIHCCSRSQPGPAVHMCICIQPPANSHSALHVYMCPPAAFKLQ